MTDLGQELRKDVMSVKSKEMLAGCIGYFWPSDDGVINTEAEPERGYIRTFEDGTISLDTLNENLDKEHWYDNEDAQFPQAIAGATEHGGIALLNVFHRGANTAYGGTKASIHHYKARSAIIGMDFTTTRSTSITEGRVFFPSAARWAGIKTSEEIPTFDEDRRYTGFTLNVTQAPVQEVAVSEEITLFITSHWEFTGPEGQRTVRAPLEVGCRSTKPLHLGSHLGPLTRIQDLINLAFQSFTPASGGRVIMADDPTPAETPHLWNSNLMTTPAFAVNSKPSSVPLFSLSALGGVDSLPRWIQVCKEHPRSVGPIINHFRRGSLSPFSRILEVGAGIENWVNSHARTSSWAKDKTVTHALAKHIGDPFESWVGGDIEKWADIFWDSYNCTKHQPSYAPDPRDV
ncbi:hypothetical protein FDA94_14530 [Herbidospora galbida]|uniref:ApeA N-terminal domain-containing protein n=1 Tax=Herbidospora galbida TaxID=2575442 RepID=A0A4V5UZE3_9ACTN|nr:hypothetical protein [Herbidospora galbida]TKK88133.1 hypothetical protein FDA94_14530 [Herbidospora galbida]